MRPEALLPVTAAAVTPERLTAMTEAIRKLHCENCDILVTRARLAPRVRLAVNLKTLLTLFAETNLEAYAAVPGLSPAEMAALSELQRKGASVDALVASHGVLNVAERGVLLHTLRGLVMSIEHRGDSALPTPA